MAAAERVGAAFALLCRDPVDVRLGLSHFLATGCQGGGPLARVGEENRRLSDLYCTGCNYCGPHCPQEIAIPRIFELMNYRRVYGMNDYANEQYRAIGTTPSKLRKADACIECGVCEDHCPQKIEVRKQLKECHEALLAAAGSRS